MARLFSFVLTLVMMGNLAAAQDSYKIRPGDTLTIEVLEDSSLNRDALVLPDGSISLPMVGSVRASGRDVSALQASITSGLAPNFAAEPTVFVTVSSVAQVQSTGSGGPTIDVYAMGEVNNPGMTSISRGTNILQFLAQNGGMTRFAATKRIQVRRTDKKTGKTSVYGFNYNAVEMGAANVASIVLKDGDVIVVPERRLFE